MRRELGPTSRPDDPRPHGTTIVLTEPGPRTVYFRRRDVTIQSGMIIVGHRLYRFADIGRVWRRDPTRPGEAAIAAVLGVALAAWSFAEGIYVLALGILVVAGIVAAARYFQRPRHELWISYRGEDVLLLASDELFHIGEVSRALLRALETEGHA